MSISLRTTVPPSAIDNSSHFGGSAFANAEVEQLATLIVHCAQIKSGWFGQWKTFTASDVRGLERIASGSSSAKGAIEGWLKHLVDGGHLEVATPGTSFRDASYRVTSKFIETLRNFVNPSVIDRHETLSTIGDQLAAAGYAVAVDKHDGPRAAALLFAPQGPKPERVLGSVSFWGGKCLVGEYAPFYGQVSNPRFSQALEVVRAALAATRTPVETRYVPSEAGRFIEA